MSSKRPASTVRSTCLDRIGGDIDHLDNQIIEGDAGDLGRILERLEQPGLRPFVNGETHHLDTSDKRRTGRLVVVVAHEDVGERGLAGPVRPHQGVYFTKRNDEVDPLEDLEVPQPCRQVRDLQRVRHQDAPSMVT